MVLSLRWVCVLWVSWYGLIWLRGFLFGYGRLFVWVLCCWVLVIWVYLVVFAWIGLCYYCLVGVTFGWLCSLVLDGIGVVDWFGIRCLLWI